MRGRVMDVPDQQRAIVAGGIQGPAIRGQDDSSRPASVYPELVALLAGGQFPKADGLVVASPPCAYVGGSTEKERR